MSPPKDGRVVKVPVKRRLSNFSAALEYKVLFEKNINLTKDRAFQFLELKTFPGERSVREKHVQFLYDELSAGRFLWHNVYLASARLGEETYRINGQHTCWMRVNMPDDVETRCDCIERLYEVKSDEQLRNLYSAFDRGAPRTVAHISRVLLMGTEAGREIPVSYLGKLVAGFRVYFSEDWHTVNANPNDLTGMIEANYSELFNIVGRFFQIHADEGKCFQRAAVVGAMFATFEKNIQASDNFWSPIWSGIGLESKSDARWRLRNFIENHGHGLAASIRDSRTATVGKEELYRICILAWNRWRSGEEVAMLQATDRRLKPKA